MAKTKSGKNTSKELISALDQILEAELSGVVRYLHYSFMIFGPNRIPITKWFREQAMEGIQHAVTIGEKITALGGHPSVKVQPVPETNNHNVMEILEESLEFEHEGLKLYHNLLEKLDGDVALEEMVRGLILEETTHIEEVEKMTRAIK
jgi:bacterioferritin